MHDSYLIYWLSSLSIGLDHKYFILCEKGFSFTFNQLTSLVWIFATFETFPVFFFFFIFFKKPEIFVAVEVFLNQSKYLPLFLQMNVF